MVPDSDALAREIARMDYESHIKDASDRTKFQHETGLAANRSIMVANGGAIVALLTFVGNRQAVYDASSLRDAFVLFGVGIATTLLSFLTVYIAQEWHSINDTNIAWDFQRDMEGEERIYQKPRHGKIGWALMVIAAALSLIGVIVFGVGAWLAIDGILPPT